MPTEGALSEAEVELFRAVLARSAAPVESELRGASMEPAIPAGSRVRITPHDDERLRVGQVVVFVAGSRVMVHRIVHVGARGAARAFVITQGDGNWLCDPPVERARIAGEVVDCRVDEAWRAVPAARISLVRRGFAYPVLVVLRYVLERDPAAAARMARVMSIARMRVRAAWHAIRGQARPDVRN